MSNAKKLTEEEEEGGEGGGGGGEKFSIITQLSFKQSLAMTKFKMWIKKMR